MKPAARSAAHLGLRPAFFGLKTIVRAVVGLYNESNYCFSNSTLQCLRHSPGFVPVLQEAALRVNGLSKYARPPSRVASVMPMPSGLSLPHPLLTSLSAATSPQRIILR